MKKILFGLLALSSLSFAAQTYPNANTATVPINVKATVVNPSTQLTIFDAKNNVAINEIIINHDIIDMSNFEKNYSATGKFRVARSADGTVSFIDGDVLDFEISKSTTDLKLRGTGDPLLTSTLTGTFITQTNGSPITEQQTITSNLTKKSDSLPLKAGDYSSTESKLTVTLNKIKVTP